jgi:hypothetical protein
MPVVTLSQIVGTAKLTGGITSQIATMGSNDGDWLTRVTKILELVDNIYSKYAKQAQPATEQQINIDRSPQTALLPQQAAGVASENQDKMNMITKALLAKIEINLDDAIKINPNMPIGEFITKLDFLTVSELKQILQMLKMAGMLK